MAQRSGRGHPVGGQRPVIRGWPHIAWTQSSTGSARDVGTLRELSADPAVHGILLQHPVGEHIDERA
ncbi:hypothetical protein ABZ372_50270, partial [Streptomyces sp. NPDC005921]